MQPIIKEYLENLQFGQPQIHENMAVVPLLGHDVAAADYLMLDEALSQNMAEITEISKEGSVPELCLVNKSEKMLLVFAGEELVGARQNRLLNASMLIQAKTKTTIPVSCCESGRWNLNSPSFTSENRMAFRKLRQKKAEHISLSTRQDGSFRSNQGEVWDVISNRLKNRKAFSSSSAMSSIHDNEIDKAAVETYMQHFSFVDYQVGALFLINGVVAGIEGFGKHDTLSKIFQKLVQSYVLDAIDDKNNDKVVDSWNLETQGNAFVQQILNSTAEEYKSVGLGIDSRLSQTVNGFALTFESLLHLSVFPLVSNNNRQTRMMKSSMRRRRMH